ncbi:putative methyltransferase C1B3.06c [Pseudocercospora fuligena]|uniref:Putative methyltransferase C1B3.06c n=1 Tax=Pseudocercospora fuligena TaxID=685502 RepID=A0A8H6RC70_9PEZI|nr:putative methyltransferase C1B3.06c [Pseudocercospora fuligena]
MASTTSNQDFSRPAHQPYTIGYQKSHIQNHNWRTAENSSAFLLPHLISKAQSNPHLKLLDCGAGPGTITASFSKYMPSGQIIATDLSEDVMAQARAHATSQGITNMTCQAASIYDLPFEDESFDIVHAQQVLVHLDDPVKAIEEMLRVCKSDGIVALRESDMRMWCFYPETKELVAFHKLIQAVMQSSGGAPDTGVRLVSLVMEAGVKRERIEASMGTWCYSTPEERSVWGGTFVSRLRGEDMKTKAGRLGYEESELESMAKGWEEWIGTEDATFGCLHGEIIVRKP